MIFQIRSTLALVPRVHVEEVYMRYAYAAMGKGPNSRLTCIRLHLSSLLIYGLIYK
jgi:hypothetical protein